jgi:hypothetical protein
MSEEPEQVTLSDSSWKSTETASTAQRETQQSTSEKADQRSTPTTKPSGTQQPIEDSFTFERGDLPAAAEPLTQNALDSLLSNGPNAPLSESVKSVASHSPVPDSEKQRRARGLFIYGCAQMGALNGYDLSASMINLRDCIEDKLAISTKELVENGQLREKRLDGRWKYYRLTEAGRRFIEKADHPTFDMLRPVVDRAIVGDGPIHNRGVLLGGDWLIRETATENVVQPELDTEVELDLGGYVDGERRWLGEVVAREDVHPDSGARNEPAETFLKRIRHLENRSEQTFLVFESSPVAVRAINRLDAEGIFDLPADIDYRQYSIAQLREHLLPRIEHCPFDHIESLATLLEGR